MDSDIYSQALVGSILLTGGLNKKGPDRFKYLNARPCLSSGNGTKSEELD